ncbi:MAG: DUF1761 domain-containing protein [Candidatus Kapaibacterium sp.]|nr:MAG: DUF1761 domain-containing protein [Candidatus Kapabacteria bacterium]
MIKLRINHLAVWAVVLLQQGIDLTWYGLLRNKWMQLLAKQAIDFEATSVFAYIISISGEIASCYVTAFIFTKLNIDNVRDGILLAALLWIGYTFFPLAQTDLFSLRPIGLSFINGGGVLINAIVCGAMLGAWRKYEEK